MSRLAVLSPTVTVDVSHLVTRNRHPLIFGIFTALPMGEAMLLSNDHDPKPLFYQFQAESAGQFSWDYVEQGPDRWQIQIGRIGEAIKAKTGGNCCSGAGD